MAGGAGGIGSQITGELKNLGKDVGQALADLPKQIIEGPVKASTSNPKDAEGQALEAGQQVGDDTQAKKPATAASQGGSPLSSQLGMANAQQKTQKRLGQVRRNLEEEIKRIRQEKGQKAEAEKQEEEQQEQMDEQQNQQKKQIQRQRAVAGLAPGQFGKGETRGAKGS